MWSMVAQRLTHITPPDATSDQLWQRVESAWSAVSQEHIQGILLLASGESTVSTLTEEKASDPSTSTILSIADTSSLGLDVTPLDSKTESTPKENENLASTVLFLALEGSSETSEAPRDETSDVNKEDVSTEVPITELYSSSSNTATLSSTKLDFENATSISELNKFNEGNESELDLKTSEEKTKISSTEKTPVSSSDVPESLTSSNELNTTNFNLSELDATLLANGTTDLEGIEETEFSKFPSSTTPRSTKKRSPTDATLMDKSTPVKSTDEYSTIMDTGSKKLLQTSSTQSSKEDLTLLSDESTRYLENDALKLVTNMETTSISSTYKDEMSHNPLSLQNTTPKSATRKRSLNSTGDSRPFEEITSTSDSFTSVSLQPQLFTLIEHRDSPLPESVSEVTLLSRSNINNAETTSHEKITVPNSEKMDGMQTQASSQGSQEMYLSSISPDIEREKNFNTTEKNIEFLDQESKSRIPDYSVSPLNEPLNLSNYGNTDAQMTNDNTKTASYSESSFNTPKFSEDYHYLNNVDHVDYSFTEGVTFDPDGMRNSGPQDPDSVVFYVPSTTTSRLSTPEIIHHTTDNKEVNSNTESEDDFVIVMDKKVNEESNVKNGTVEFEKLEHVTLDKNREILPLPSLVPDIAPELNTSHMNNQSLLPPGWSFWDPSKSGWILPGNEKSKDSEVNDESEEMLQDAPHFSETDLTQNNPTNFQPEITFKEKNTAKTTDLPTSSHSIDSISDVKTTVTEIGILETSNSFESHQTDQSVIRPVKIRPTSPEDKSVSTSILPDSFSTQATGQSTVMKSSVPIAGSITFASDKIETSSIDTSSPVILPNPAPSVTEIEKDPELSTMVIQPELVPLSLDIKAPEATGPTNTSAANSTIAGIAVKTSVSVSLPLSNTNNGSQSFELPMNISNNTSILPIPVNVPPSVIPKDSGASSFDPSTEGLISSTVQTTTASGFKILKPKLKIPGRTDSFTPRPVRPYSPVLKRPTTTAGPPVSIFNKARTRVASITSSTTPRTFRPFSTIRVQYASDIPGMIPFGELIISTDPVPTTTEVTTTEEPISEVPFTDQTHVPTVANEDDVTLVKVAGYIVIDRGLKWNDLLHNRHSPEYKKNSEMMHLYLERMFRSSLIAARLWKIEIDGFSGNKKTRPVGVDFFLYLIKTGENIATDHLATVFHEKLSTNNTFGTFRVDPSKTAFENLNVAEVIQWSVCLISNPGVTEGPPCRRADHLLLNQLKWAGGSLVVRASDSRPEGLDSMPDATKYLRVHTEYVLVKSVGPKLLWVESRVQGTGEYFPSVPCLNCGGGDTWCRHLSSLRGISPS
ncbi:SEA domain-containing protein [Trichonephila clavipes]|nr:SEA domain-containing protein [Trichonephila clavipes]